MTAKSRIANHLKAKTLDFYQADLILTAFGCIEEWYVNPELRACREELDAA